MIYSDNELSLKSFQSLKIDVPKLGKFRNLKPPLLPHSPAPFPHQPLFSRLLHIFLNPHSPIPPSFFEPISSFFNILHYPILLPSLTLLNPIPPFPFPSSFLMHYSSNSTILHSSVSFPFFISHSLFFQLHYSSFLSVSPEPSVSLAPLVSLNHWFLINSLSFHILNRFS